MDLKTVEKLVSMLPDGPKKNEFLAKLRAARQRNQGGLHDTVEYRPVGHIKIEAIDEEGKVTGVLAEQPNLVVHGAEEILLRAFAGDPERCLYKNRIPKTNPSPVYFVALPDGVFSTTDSAGNTQLNHKPNTFWAAVNDADFNITYSYRPITMWIKQVTPSPQPDKVAFQIYSSPVSDGIPISSEIYSSATNMFIGIGDGLRKSVPLSDTRLTWTAGFAADASGHMVSTTVGDTVSFAEKISNFAVSYQKSNTGGQIGVYINGVLKETIETYDSSLDTPVEEQKVYDSLDPTVATNVELRFAGADESIASPQLVITDLQWDALQVSDASLIHEFENYTNVFDTPSAFSTTTTSPFTVQLPNYPVDPESVVVTYNNVTLTQVQKQSDVVDGTYYVDGLHGKLYFSRALSHLLITYNTTGEIYNLVNPAILTSVTANSRPAWEFVHEEKYRPTDGTIIVRNPDTGAQYTQVSADTAMGQGKFMIDTADGANKNIGIIIDQQDPDGNTPTKLEILFKSVDRPGVPTGYTRQVIQKPKSGVGYPWYSLDSGSVSFVTEFPAGVPAGDVTIREMILADGPRVEDGIPGYNNYPVHTFSLVRVGETRKESTTGIRVTWTITLQNSSGQPFTGGTQ
ncbi:hypothetical protein [Alicyclobacillus shizuokensis]|uniref:hypothetical protein n=1 Tax=Alicyclobacillus shizuokensis TaxID=392014 RepID=UPI00082B69EF|nr:hypothetical protein [Alicyclobacillus shizuokensis]